MEALGVIVAVDGDIATVGMYNMSNDSTFLWDGSLLNGPKIGAFLTIEQNNVRIVSTVISEKIQDQQNTVNSEQFDNRYRKNSINRILMLKTQGVIDENKFQLTSQYVPMVGNKVVITTKEDLKAIYDVDDVGSTISIGKSIREGQEINLPINEFFASHIGIFGNTGSGKSNTLHKLYLELFKSKYRESIFKKSRFVVIDFNGEYTQDKQFGVEKKHKRIFRISTRGKTDKIPITKEYFLDPEFLSLLFSAKKATQVPFLKSAIREYKKINKVENNLIVHLKSCLLFSGKNLNLLNLNLLYINPRVKKTIRRVKKTIRFKSFIQKSNKFQISLNFANLEVGLLKSLLRDFRNIETIAIEDWIDIAHDMGVKNKFLDYLEDSQKYLSYGNVYIDINESSDIKHMFKNGELSEESKIEVLNIRDEIANLYEKKTDIQKIRYFLKFQKIFKTAWKTTNSDYINPLFGRINETLERLEPIIKLVNTDKAVESEFKSLNIISLVNTNQEMKRLIPMMVSKMLYDIQKKRISNTDSIDFTYHLIIDEAHNILNSEHIKNGDNWQDYRLSVFEEIIKEGRKFGFYLTLASQRPADISSTIMSQIHNFFIHRLVNDNDLDMLSRTVPTLDKNSYKMLPTLGKGEALVTGNAIKIPVLLKVDKEKSIRPKSDDVKLTKLWKN
ncbi:ATP-binding protein [Lactobacillus rizhaonensis]|uniref:ATP-binding protein n=1 Tax=Lactobacillus rizhaonensis TaxID=3082863 RepID=UPI0030C783E0|nr:DUF87 domain-containing protein [Lactobacillus sp.]